MAKKRAKYDWEAIEREYRTGQLSVREIARMFGCSEGAIRKKVKGQGWTQKLTGRVKEGIKEELVRSEVRTEVRTSNVSDKEVVEHAIKRGTGVVLSHRNDINKLRELEAGLIKELSGTPTKLYLTQYKGLIVQKEVSLTASERAQAANNLANVQHKRIQLERQAFNLNDGDGGEKTDNMSKILADLDVGGLPTK